MVFGGNAFVLNGHWPPAKFDNAGFKSLMDMEKGGLLGKSLLGRSRGFQGGFLLSLIDLGPVLWERFLWCY
jgi:hypothetical protein